MNLKRLDCVTIYATPDGNLAFNSVLEGALRNNLIKYPRYGYILE